MSTGLHIATGALVMNLRQHLQAAVLCLAFLPAAAHAAPPPYSAIYVFGDSYCDVGNIAAATGGLIPGPAYYHGRFSNGPIWVEHVASAIGLPMTPSLLGGTDYAVGGALVTADVATLLGPIPSVPSQIAQYLAQHGGKADPKALYIIEGGGNDILNAPAGTSYTDLGYAIALGLSNGQKSLVQAGAKHVMISNLLDVGLLPAAQANAAFATQASIYTNAALASILGYEQNLEGIHITTLDVYSLFHAIAADVTHFGFTNITTPCLIGTTVCASPAYNLFWDAEHPTVFGHSFFAVTVEAALPH